MTGRSRLVDQQQDGVAVAVEPYLAHGLIWGSLVGGVLALRWWNEPRRVARRVIRRLTRDPWQGLAEQRSTGPLTKQEALLIRDTLWARGHDTLLLGPWPDARKTRRGWSVTVYHHSTGPAHARVLLLRDEARERAYRYAESQGGRR